MPTGLKPNGEVARETMLEDGDDLGWYPDGNKRTLTDDQIAMFRHSEVYSLLREQQVRKENREADGEDHTGDFVSTGTVTPENTRSHAPDSNEDLAEAQRDQYQNSAVDPRPTFPTSSSKNKRKRNLEDTGAKSVKASTRRLVRELDSVAAEDQILDYGDEAAADVSPTNVPPDGATVTALPAHNATVSGKKIWWPTIQTT